MFKLIINFFKLKMNESKPNVSEKINDLAPAFHTVSPDVRLTNQPTQTINSNEIRVAINPPNLMDTIRTIINRPTIFGTSFIITHVCLGNFAIFSLAQKTKSFGLVWIIIFCVLVGIINYWSIMRGFFASIKLKDTNYSELTEKYLGKNARRILNLIIMIYSFLYMMYLVGLTFPLIGRIVKIISYNKQYQSYDTFLKEKWGVGFIKYIFFICVGFCFYIITVFKFIKLRFISFYRIITFTFCVLFLIVQCPSYYKHYKNEIYNKNDKNTYPNWTDLSQAFTAKMEFFKGLSILFASYTCMPFMFPIFEQFKIQENPLKKTRTSVFFGTLLLTTFTIISIICSYLINPYSPEEFIFFRENKNHDIDVFLIITNFILVICIILTVPRYYLMLKINFKILFFKNKTKLLEKLNNIFTFIFCFGSAIASIYFDGYLSYLSYIGGFFSVFINYLFPILIYVNSSEKKFKYWINIIHIILAVILCIIGIIGGISTLVDDIKK